MNSTNTTVIQNGRLSHVQRRIALRREALMKQFGVKNHHSLRAILGPTCLFKDEGAILKSLTYPGKYRRRLLKKSGKRTQSKFKDDANLVEEIDYTDSTTFLKGNQSSNPHNDYCQHFVDTGDRPQNFIRDTGLKHRFEEYPKLRELIRLKDEQISKTATPPMYLKCDLSTFDLSQLECKFDVIYIDPPLEEYNTSNGVTYDRYFSWKEIERLKIEDISAQRSFCWIWCGSGEGLDEARKCLQKWGFRRCEDICWIKTNRTRSGHKNLEGDAVFQRTKEHCLMGIKGTVKRSVDGDFIHANVDIDLIIDEEPPYGVKEKPIEIFHIMEHFCLGRRRIHVFGRDNTIRPGWLSVGSELASSNFDASIYQSYFTQDSSNGYLTGCTDEIERLRPKSPPPKQKMGDGRNAEGGSGGGGLDVINDGQHWTPKPSVGGPLFSGLTNNFMHHSTGLNHSVMFPTAQFMPPNILSPIFQLHSGNLLSNLQRNILNNYGLMNPSGSGGGLVIPHGSTKNIDGPFSSTVYFQKPVVNSPFPALLQASANLPGALLTANKYLWHNSNAGRSASDNLPIPLITDNISNINARQQHSRNRETRR